MTERRTIQNDFPSLRLDCERTIKRLRTGELESGIEADAARAGSFFADAGEALNDIIEGMSAEPPAPEQNDQQNINQSTRPKPRTGR
jgi:hypothetical protein